MQLKCTYFSQGIDSYKKLDSMANQHIHEKRYVQLFRTSEEFLVHTYMPNNKPKNNVEFVFSESPVFSCIYMC